MELVVDEENGKEGNHQQNRQPKRRLGVWTKWASLCRHINHTLEGLFTRLGFVISKRPLPTIIVGLLLCLLLTAGFSQYRLIQRSEDLYLPQSSQALKDLNRVEEHFPMRYKMESFIILPRKGNPLALTDEIFRTALEIHEGIISIPGFEDVCVKNPRSQTCIYLSPLEFFDYDTNKMDNVSETLNMIYNNPRILASNGRQGFTNFKNYFSYFKFDDNTKTIISAEALKVEYLVKDPTNNDIYERLTEFETKFLDYMEPTEKSLRSKGFTFLYNCGRSIDISVNDSAKKDITLMPVAFLLMVLFCGITLARFKNRILGHFKLALAGVFTLFIGILSAFSFVMLIGTPYVAFAGVLPFLVLGVGIDNMFIIIDAVDRQHPSVTSDKRIARALGQVGASISMTTLTDLVAFFVSMVTDFPAIRYFCMYAAFSIIFCYILVITVFIGLLTFDVRRIEAGRLDLVPCLRKKENEEDEDVWENGSDTISNKIITWYAKKLMKTPCKIVVIVLSVLLVAFGVNGSVNIDQSFDVLVLGLKGSPYVRYYTYRDTAYPTGIPISVVLDTPSSYDNAAFQEQFVDLSRIIDENKYTKSNHYNWLGTMRYWAKQNNANMTGKRFYSALYLFLREHPQFLVDIKFTDQWMEKLQMRIKVKNIVVTQDNVDTVFDQFLMENQNLLTRRLSSSSLSLIKASRVYVFNKDNANSIYRKDAMLSLREDLRIKSRLPVYGIGYFYIFFEQFVIILPDTVRNLAICAGAILFITLPYLVDPKVTFFVFFGFVCLMFELFGVMLLWGVSLNAISMIVIVMGIGFSVDYSAHIAHAFVMSNEKTSEARAVYAMKTMGASVTMGGVSTFIGVLVTAFSRSELFKIFFKMVFGIVTLGLIHGLVFLPVFLAVFCRNNVPIRLEEEEEEEEEEKQDMMKDKNGTQFELADKNRDPATTETA